MEIIEMTDPSKKKSLHVGSGDDGGSNRGEATFGCAEPGVTDCVLTSKPRECCELATGPCSFKRPEKRRSHPDNEQICNPVTKRTGSRADGGKTPGITDTLCSKRASRSGSCDNSDTHTPFFPLRALRSHSAPCNRLSVTPATSVARAKHKNAAVRDTCRQSRKGAEYTAGNTAICEEQSHCVQKKSLVAYPGKRRCTCDFASSQTSGSPTRSVDPWAETVTLNAGGSGSQPACKKICTDVGKGPLFCSVHSMVRGPTGTDLHDTRRKPCKKSHMLQRMSAKNWANRHLKRKWKVLLQKVKWKLQECNKCRKKMTVAVIKTRHQPPGEACRWTLRSFSSGQKKSCLACMKKMHDRRISSGKKAYSCSECGKLFLQPTLLDLHQKSHTEEKLFVCPLCGKRFVQHSLLLLHQKAHTVNKPFQCMDCGNLFFSKSLFAEHLRTHKEEKPFRCLDCEKCFADNTTLVIHQRIHTGEKPFSCQKCGKCFSQPSTLASHELIHSGEKPYECQVCGKRFRDRSSSACHQRIHNGEKPFKCQACGKRFTQSSNLRRHERLHTGQKPFACIKCGKSFNESGKLKSHENVHLKKERQLAQKTK